MGPPRSRVYSDYVRYAFEALIRRIQSMRLKWVPLRAQAGHYPYLGTNKWAFPDTCRSPQSAEATTCTHRFEGPPIVFNQPSNRKPLVRGTLRTIIAHLRENVKLLTQRSFSWLTKQHIHAMVYHIGYLSMGMGLLAGHQCQPCVVCSHCSDGRK
jgi:hypothetical protein